jgi:hypothetical protein
MMTLHMQMAFGWKYQLFPKKSLALGFFKRNTKPKWTNEERATAIVIRRTLFNEDLPYDTSIITEPENIATKWSPAGNPVVFCKTDKPLNRE